MRYLFSSRFERDRHFISLGVDHGTAEEAEYLVLRRFGLDVELAALDEVDEGKLIFRELEEVVLFGDGFGGLAVGADGAGRPFDEHLFADRVLAGVRGEVDG